MCEHAICKDLSTPWHKSVAVVYTQCVAVGRARVRKGVIMCQQLEVNLLSTSLPNQLSCTGAFSSAGTIAPVYGLSAQRNTV